jgi:L-fuculose-phosphate aldolase
MSPIELQHLKVVTGRDLEPALAPGATELRVDEDAILTPTARDVIQRAGLSIVRVRPARAGSARSNGSNVAPGLRTMFAGVRGAEAAFRSREAQAIKEEIVRVGRKLWERQFVDGNGGNISCRLTDEWVICTPTLMSKADMTVDDMCLVDLAGNQLAGTRKRSSEILLHLEIFKAVPEATSVLHCHPPHATAYALVGVVPPTCMISEHEIFIGPVALTPYETPGTIECARAVVPYVRDHNTVLMANHGLVCWADTITHAEWYAEVMDTTCRILILASHLGESPSQIPSGKIGDLLATKQRLGMPDARFNRPECKQCDLPSPPAGITTTPCASAPGPQAERGDRIDREAVVRAVTDKVLAELGRGK